MLEQLVSGLLGNTRKIIPNESMGTGETIGRSVDKIIGLCVSGVVTLALAAVTLKMVSYHNDLYDEAEEDGEEKSSRTKSTHSRKKSAKVVGDKFIVLDDHGNVVFGDGSPEAASKKGGRGRGGGGSGSNKRKGKGIMPEGAWMTGFVKNLMSGVLYAAVTAGVNHLAGKYPGSSRRVGKKSSDPYFEAAYNSVPSEDDGSSRLITHRGSCHCNSIRFTLKAPLTPKAYDCKAKIRYPHYRASSQTFHITQGTSNLQIYYVDLVETELKSVAAHGFCSQCGVHLFRAPCHTRDCIEVNVNCVDGGTADTMEVHFYDGSKPSAMGAGVSTQKQFVPPSASSGVSCAKSTGSGPGASSCTGETPSSTSDLTTALAARRIDPYVYSSPPSALMAFDAFEKQINQHHIRSNRGPGSTSDPTPVVKSASAQLNSPVKSKVRGGAGQPTPITLKLAPSPSKNNVPMDTPMKNQLHYYLSRHLGREFEEQENWKPNERR